MQRVQLCVVTNPSWRRHTTRVLVWPRVLQRSGAHHRAPCGKCLAPAMVNHRFRARASGNTGTITSTTHASEVEQPSEVKRKDGDAARTGWRSWWGDLKSAAHASRDHLLTDWAAALTYYAVLSLFPAMLVLV